MSSAPDTKRMPYELSVEEISAFIAPLVGLGETRPSSQKWLKRWPLANSILVEFSGRKYFVVSGYRFPLSAQVEIRDTLRKDVDGLMPGFYGSFVVGHTTFAITDVPAGKPIEDKKDFPRIVEALYSLQSAFCKGWGERPFPNGINLTDFEFEGLKKVAFRKREMKERVSSLFEALEKIDFSELKKYPMGLIHGDPGVDNAFVSDNCVVFTDGPIECGPEIVDVAYLLQSAAASLQDFKIEPVIALLSRRYSSPDAAIRNDLFLADILAHATVIRWFNSLASEFLPEYEELYDDLILERICALEKVLNIY